MLSVEKCVCVCMCLRNRHCVQASGRQNTRYNSFSDLTSCVDSRHPVTGDKSHLHCKDDWAAVKHRRAALQSNLHTSLLRPELKHSIWENFFTSTQTKNYTDKHCDKCLTNGFLSSVGSRSPTCTSWKIEEVATIWGENRRPLKVIGSAFPFEGTGGVVCSVGPRLPPSINMGQQTVSRSDI